MANSKLAKKIGSMKPKENLVSAQNISKPNTTNRQGYDAYSQDKWLRLLTMLNTLKVEPQYYRNETQTLSELKDLIHICALENPYLTCQCIVWSRCLGEGMRTISHAASIFIAPYISGQEYSKRFYGLWNKKEKKGGVIYRPDDMSEIINGFFTINSKVTTITENTSTSITTTTKLSGVKLSNAMKKGFKSALESMDSHSLLKYKNDLIDVINLVHPNPNLSKSISKVDGNEIPTLSVIIQGLQVSANTWEVNQGESGQMVAQAVRDGKITKEEAKEILVEAKADNWEELLNEGKLGILAAIRNLRNILKNNPKPETIDKLCTLVSNETLIRQGKIFPYQLDIANEIVISEFNSPNSRKISQALLQGYELSIPNLKEILTGNNLVIIDLSGSMSISIKLENGKYSTSCRSKAGLIAATIAKSTNADVIQFGSTAQIASYNPNTDVFSLGKTLSYPNLGMTDLASAWNLATKSKIKYDRVFILSDNECNVGKTYDKYKSYVEQVGNPYVYSIDMAGYGTNVLAGFDDIARVEFKAEDYLNKVKQVII